MRLTVIQGQAVFNVKADISRLSLYYTRRLSFASYSHNTVLSSVFLIFTCKEGSVGGYIVKPTIDRTTMRGCSVGFFSDSQ